ncbi:MAG: hypothetical protein GY777_29465 [Candidatus Brocadiaceae bacterium]|nr:hypothetical protein [Candidatus Brocadiaceae bacterium]
MKKKLPILKSNKEAAEFVENEDLREYDLSGGRRVRFESIKKGAVEALAWKQGRKTGARLRQYTAMDVSRNT